MSTHYCYRVHCCCSQRIARYRHNTVQLRSRDCLHTGFHPWLCCMNCLGLQLPVRTRQLQIMNCTCLCMSPDRSRHRSRCSIAIARCFVPPLAEILSLIQHRQLVRHCWLCKSVLCCSKSAILDSHMDWRSRELTGSDNGFRGVVWHCRLRH